MALMKAIQKHTVSILNDFVQFHGLNIDVNGWLSQQPKQKDKRYSKRNNKNKGTKTGKVSSWIAFCKVHQQQLKVPIDQFIKDHRKSFDPTTLPDKKQESIIEKYRKKYGKEPKNVKKAWKKLLKNAKTIPALKMAQSDLWATINDKQKYIEIASEMTKVNKQQIEEQKDIESDSDAVPAPKQAESESDSDSDVPAEQPKLVKNPESESDSDSDSDVAAEEPPKEVDLDTELDLDTESDSD
jgi:DNA repair ATPase RecN